MGIFEFTLMMILLGGFVIVSMMYLSLSAKYLSLEKAANLAVKVLEQQASLLEAYALSKPSSKFTPDAKEAIIKKLQDIADINKKQIDLISALDAPSASAAHSKYKNEVMGQYKELDSQKMKVMSEVVDLGYDPEVTTVDGYGQTKKATFSSIIKDTLSSKTTTPTETKPKLTLVKTQEETKNECTEQNPQG